MEITITTPALLFLAISLLMISYTTRFLHLANLARSLHAINPIKERTYDGIFTVYIRRDSKERLG